MASLTDAIEHEMLMLYAMGCLCNVNLGDFLIPELPRLATGPPISGLETPPRTPLGSPPKIPKI